MRSFSRSRKCRKHHWGPVRPLTRQFKSRVSSLRRSDFPPVPAYSLGSSATSLAETFCCRTTAKCSRIQRIRSPRHASFRPFSRPFPHAALVQRQGCHRAPCPRVLLQWRRAWRIAAIVPRSAPEDAHVGDSEHRNSLILNAKLFPFVHSVRVCKHAAPGPFMQLVDSLRNHSWHAHCVSAGEDTPDWRTSC